MPAVPANKLPKHPSLMDDLSAALLNWASSQRAVVGLAAAFADSAEWATGGAVSAAHWIAEVADIDVSTAREWIRIGRRLRVLPEIEAAFDADEISYSKVRTLTRLATPENAAELLHIAQGVPAGHLARALSAWMSRTSTAAELERHHQSQRSITWRTEPDGMVAFALRLPPLVAGALIAQLTTNVMTTQPKVTDVEDWPSLAQQHADAFEELLNDGAGDVVTEVLLHVRGDGCTLDDGTAIPDSVVERIAPESFIRLLLHDAERRPINSSSRRRHPSARQRRVVKERDRGCVDCGATMLLEFDHVPDFAITGHSVVEELELRCAPCHHRRHAPSGAA